MAQLTLKGNGKQDWLDYCTCWPKPTQNSPWSREHGHPFKTMRLAHLSSKSGFSGYIFKIKSPSPYSLKVYSTCWTKQIRSLMLGLVLARATHSISISLRSTEPHTTACIWLWLQRNQMINRALNDTREIPEWRQARFKAREQKDRKGKPLRSWVSPTAWQRHLLIVASNPDWSRPVHSHWWRPLSHAEPVIKTTLRLDLHRLTQRRDPQFAWRNRWRGFHCADP